MATLETLSLPSIDLSLTSLILSTILLSVASLLLLTYTYTTLTYRLSIRNLTSGSLSKPLPPPRLPYTLPFLGHALSFTSTTPGTYFRYLQTRFSSHHTLGILTLLLAGQRAHILNSPDLVTKLFKSKGLSRERFNRDIMVKAMGLDDEDYRRAYGGMRDGKERGGALMGEVDHDINTDFLVGQGPVNVLTRKFMEVFEEELGKVSEKGKEVEVPFYEFLREKMFLASTTALFGREIVRMNPELSQYYWDFDNGMLARLFGVPRFMTPESYKSLDFMIDRWEQWVKLVRSKYHDEPPEGMQWDALMGSSVVRQRHRMYHSFHISDRGRARYDLGFLFG